MHGDQIADDGDDRGLQVALFHCARYKLIENWLAGDI